MRFCIYLFFGIIITHQALAQKPVVTMQMLRKSEITIFQVDSFQVDSADQSMVSQYILDYLIKKTVYLNKGETIKIRKSLLDSANYIYDVARSCPFIAKYALRIKKKDTTTEIIIGNENCQKIMVWAIENNKISIIDLAEKNKLFILMNELLE